MIEAVVRGEADACQDVLHSFESYITKVCSTPVVMEDGKKVMELDIAMKQAVEQKLLYAIANKFEMLPLG